MEDDFLEIVNFSPNLLREALVSAALATGGDPDRIAGLPFGTVPLIGATVIAEADAAGATTARRSLHRDVRNWLFRNGFLQRSQTRGCNCPAKPKMMAQPPPFQFRTPR